VIGGFQHAVFIFMYEYIHIYIYVGFLVLLEFELMAMHLPGRHSIC
jgi:hypothetical protein